MEKEFKSTKHVVFQLIFGLLPILLSLSFIIAVLYIAQSTDDLVLNMVWIGLMILVLVLFWLMIWMLQNTGYKIDQDHLQYRCGISRGKIPISQIKSIVKSKYPAAGNKPAMDFDGLTIFYGAGRTIFLSPEKSDEFIKSLQTINKNILTKQS